MTSFLFHGGRFLDPRKGELEDGVDVLVEGGRVKETGRIASSGAERIDLKGRTIMPGLIDAHIHIFLAAVNLGELETMPLTLLAAKGTVTMREMLMRGFTSVRDTGGGDFGMKLAAEQGIVESPRLFISGMAISQTGGHGDFRRKTQSEVDCACCNAVAYLGRIADGVPEMVKAVRDELRKGADQIKIMVSGGVASQSDPLEAMQFRRDEIEAAVEECANWGSYVLAHAYTAEAIHRAVECGVRTIEHGNLIDEKTAKLMAGRGAYLVPTLVAYDQLKARGPRMGITPYSLEKNEIVLKAGLRSLELARDAGVKIGFGSDLIGDLRDEQCREFLIRAEVMKPHEIIRSATIVNAEIVQQAGRLGELVPGAHADLLVIDGDPTRDLALFQNQGAHIAAIMKGGKFFKNKLA